MNNNGTAVKATNEAAFQEALDESIQQGGRERGEGGYALLRWLGSADSILPPWWSKARDARLRSFWKTGDHISGAVYSVATRIVTTPFQILPRDESVKAHIKQAEQMETMLREYSDFGQGWASTMSKFVQDILTQDNGGFLEVIGAGDPDGPILGMPVGIAHLDSHGCMRTSDPEYPVIFQDIDGRRYKLHYTRVIARAQLPSPDREMYGVGLCAVSRAVYSAQNLIDMAVYKMEKMGSRPPRQLLVGSNISAAKILEAFIIANSQMDNQGLGRFAKTVVVGRGDGEINIDAVPLSSVPDGFSEQEATTLAMFAIALAFGVDARELWPATSSGATKADAMVQHLKARGKGLGELQKMVVQEINHKVLPAHLEMVFDAQDDEEDQVQAEIQNMRADARGKNLTAGTITVRVARLQMLSEGEITQEQFEDMELADGRLEDGTNVLALFQSPEREMQMLLGLQGIEDPLDVEANDADETRRLITERIKFLQNRLFTAPNGRLKQMAQMAIAALDMLATLYSDDVEAMAETEEEAEEVAEDEAPAQAGAGGEDEDEPADDEEPSEEESEDEDGQADEEGNSEDVKKKNVTIRPDGADKPLPDVPFDVPITDRDIRRAIESLEDTFPDMGDILDANVVNAREPTLLDMLTLARKAWTKQSTRWEYDDTAHRYRDLSTGRFLSATRLVSMRDTYQDSRQQIADDLAGSLAAGDITVQQFTQQMRDEVKVTYLAEYMLGKGGRHNMTQADYGAVGRMLRDQYAYLDSFARDMAAGNLSRAQIAARGKMYFASATQAFERAKAASNGVPRLPAYPGDGSSECRSNDKCSWRIVEMDDHYEAYWQLSTAEHCPTCLGRASQWNPLIVPKI